MKNVIQKKYWHKKIESSCGVIDLVADDRFLRIVQMKDHSFDHLVNLVLQDGKSHKILQATEIQLNEYFSGKRKTFKLPLKFEGTEFQLKAWKALLKIPYGKCITYGMQAAGIGSPKAARAVGTCNRKNPLSIVVPCHRVIGASGALVGYAGGLSIKQHLLEIEGFSL